MEKNWAELTPEEKRQQRYAWFLDTKGINFVSKEAEEAYKQRTQRLVDVYQRMDELYNCILREDDRLNAQWRWGVFHLD